MAALVLDGPRVRNLLGYSECLEQMERVFRNLHGGRAGQPLRGVMSVPGGTVLLATMPGWTGDPDTLGAKVLTVVPGNRERGRPGHQGLVALFDPEDGSVRAVIDATAITEIRTASVSALATRLLSRPDASTLSILGSGAQAEAHAHAVPLVRPVDRILIWDRRVDHARSLVERLGPIAEVVTEREAAVRGADVLCTVTGSREPLVEGPWLTEGAHVNAVGASAPGFRELSSEAVVRCRSFVDRRESAWAEADDLRVPCAEGAIDQGHVLGDLGELLEGKVTGRTSHRDVTLFKSLGLAVEDLLAARFVYERAVTTGEGVWVEF